ncbi:MAG TPA: M36 family metallopeptidase [Vicinamibacteria bacterium]|nr:M36 family metallopeptidase [Vicinamibacteria bacterium]
MTAQAAPRHPGDTSFLTGPQSGAPLDLALKYVRAHAQDYGLRESDLADMVVTRQSTSNVSGITRIVLTQRFNGIEVWNGVISIAVARDGSIINLGNNFVSNLAAQAAGQDAAISPADAVAFAAADLGLPAPDSVETLRPAVGPDRATVLTGGGISQQDIQAKLTFEPKAKGGARLAWNVVIYELDSQHWWNVRVDAVSGDVLDKNDWVVSDNWGSFQPMGDDGTGSLPPASDYTTPNPVADGSSYQVFEIPAESPNHVTPPSPGDGRTIVAQPADATASPFGWNDTNGAAGAELTVTTGNNADAYTDTDANNVPDPGSRPDGGAGLDFLFPLDLTQAPAAYRPATVANLYYSNNIIHDVSYHYGFTPTATNFQVNNYGGGGLGNDSVQAEAQDGSGTNNANFGTPADGARPRMQMFLWTTTTPGRDGDLDNGVIWHEYGHGISNRLHPTVSCLGNSEQMGEGWSDWQSVIMTMRPGESGAVGRGIGTYVLGQPTNGVGIRPARYSTDFAVNNFTYANVGSLAIPHGVGFLWNTMLWEMTWALIASHGGTIEPNLYNTASTAGNIVAHKLVMAGMDLDPCNPGFVDGRNAILAADQAMFGGANQCTIWGAFAKRGLGFSASQGSSSSTTDGTPAFDLPPTCTFGSATPPSIDVCAGTNAVYNITVGPAFSQPPASPPVTLSTTGQPVAPVFGVNPVPGPLPNTTTMTFNTTGLPAASSTVNVIGTPVGAPAQTIGSVGLNVFSGGPSGAPNLLTPANGASGQPTNPTFTWSALSGASSYVIEVDDDPAFGSINFTATVSATTTQATGLSGGTTYFWRVRGTNPCAAGGNSTVFSFTTGLCRSPNLPIPDNNPTGVTDTMVIAAGGPITDLNVSITASHTWVGDLIFTLTNTTTSTSAIVIDRPGVPASTFGCSNDNIQVIMDDEGANGPVEVMCATTPPALFGSPTPNNPLTVFDSQALAGTWTIRAADVVGSDTGTLQEWCLLPTTIPVELQTFTIE